MVRVRVPAVPVRVRVRVRVRPLVRKRATPSFRVLVVRLELIELDDVIT